MVLPPISRPRAEDNMSSTALFNQEVHKSPFIKINVITPLK